MDDTIRNRFISADADLLLAIERGQESLKTYHSMWTMLQSDFSRFMQSGDIEEETVTIAHNAAARVAAIASCFLEIESKQEALTACFLSDLDRIISDMQQLHLSDPQVPCLPSYDHAKAHVEKHDSKPPFIKAAYSFLLQNIHNPYPSSGVKQKIARSSGCSLSSVNAWFTSARRRMGWTNLCRKHFHNCKADAVDAAYRALVKEDPERRLHPMIIQEFMVVKVNAEGLYSSTFSQSSLANDLDAVVKDMTEEDRRYLEDERQRKIDDNKRRKEEEKEERRRQRALEREMRKAQPVTSYPSPAYSCASSSSSPVSTLQESLRDEHEDEQREVDIESLPPVVAGRKRRCPSVEPVEERIIPVKRARCDIQDIEHICSPLLSPQSSLDSCSDPSDTDSVESRPICSNPSSALSHTTAPPRKRRLSDADARSLPKRPRALAAGPRGHAVSDPLPKSSRLCEDAMDDWFNSNFANFFEVPPPVDSTDLDQSSPWEVQLFSDYCLPPVTNSKRDLPISRGGTVSSQGVQTNEGMTDLDDLFRSIEGCSSGSSILSQDPQPSSSEVPSSLLEPIPECAFLSSDLLRTSDWTELINPDTFIDPDTSFTGNSFSSLPTDLPQNRGFSSPPEIDFVLSQLPATWMAPSLQDKIGSGFSSNQAKMDRLQALREACQKMEREIQNEGVLI